MRVLLSLSKVYSCNKPATKRREEEEKEKNMKIRQCRHFKIFRVSACLCSSPKAKWEDNNRSGCIQRCEMIYRLNQLLVNEVQKAKISTLLCKSRAAKGQASVWHDW